MSFSFIQLADTQFGMSAGLSGKSDDEIAAFAARGLKVNKEPKFEGFAPETQAFEEAIKQANERKSEFVVVCGDMINNPESSDERDEFMRIASQLNDDIPMYWIAGNHDVAADTVTPTPASVAAYRQHWGDDYYSFQHGDASFIALNTSVMDHPEHVIGESESQMSFLKAELEAAKKRDASQIIVFTHYPLFLESSHEEDTYFSVRREHRMPVLGLLQEYGVSAVFAGHWHRNNYAQHDGMLMVATGAVGYPLGDDDSGYRVVDVNDDQISHNYYEFGFR
ncbi:MAG: metallophosphoesterase [Chloroflexi bacterium]|nr:metallophosphoesterase [Chloroflexota bacterium]